MLASDLIGRTAYDHTGRPLGIITELLAEPDPAGRWILTRVQISRRHLRLLAFDRAELTGPALLRGISRLIQGAVTEHPLTDITLTADRSGRGRSR